MLSANEVASVIVARCGRPRISSMTLQKLLYYVQAWHLAVTDEALFSDQIKAWKDGPVVPDVWHKRKDPATRSATAQVPHDVELDDLASRLIDLVLAHYGSLSGDELSALTHHEAPWNLAREGVPNGDQSRTPISRESMAEFYRRRTLDGRTAADLAAGGIPPVGPAARTRIDVDKILSRLGGMPESEEDDPWGGGNLADSRPLGNAGIQFKPKRSHADR